MSREIEVLHGVHSRAGRPLAIKTIGVGYNGSNRSAAALAVGRQLAASQGASLRALEVVCPLPTPHEAVAHDLNRRGERDGRMDLDKRVDLLLRQARARLAGLEGVEGCAVYGIAKEELVAFGEEVDLLVIGLGGRSRPRRASAQGGTSEYLQRHARCPVLVVPDPIPGGGPGRGDCCYWDASSRRPCACDPAAARGPRRLWSRGDTARWCGR